MIELFLSPYGVTLSLTIYLGINEESVKVSVPLRSNLIFNEMYGIDIDDIIKVSVPLRSNLIFNKNDLLDTIMTTR